MIRVNVVVEGQTEEDFVNGPLAEFFWPRLIFLTPIILGVPGHKGGRTSYARVRKDILLRLKQDPISYCSTMIDLYGIGPGFPGIALSENLDCVEKVRRMEVAMKQDICNEIPDFRPDARFIPYFQLHEFEALLFSNPAAFAASLGVPQLEAALQAIRAGFSTPEEINDDPVNAPSQRVLKHYPSYRKVIDGTLAARAVGIERMLGECPHFREWIARIEALTGAATAARPAPPDPSKSS